MSHNNRISIVGCGWLGLPLGAALAEEGYEVRGTTTSKDRLEKIRTHGITPFHLVVTDRLNGDTEGLLDCDTLVVNIPPGRRNPHVVMDHPLQIKAILREALNYSISHVIFISSTGVYQNTGAHMDEAGSLKPERPSGQAVLSAEAEVHRSGLPWSILRMAGLVGGDRLPGRWFAGREDIPGGDTPVNMVHRDDCIASILTLIKSGPALEGYNICADQHPTKRAFYHRQALKIEEPPPVFNQGTVPHKIIDNTRFKSKYSFHYTYPDPLDF